MPTFPCPRPRRRRLLCARPQKLTPRSAAKRARVAARPPRAISLHGPSSSRAHATVFIAGGCKNVIAHICGHILPHACGAKINGSKEYLPTVSAIGRIIFRIQKNRPAARDEQRFGFTYFLPCRRRFRGRNNRGGRKDIHGRTRRMQTISGRLLRRMGIELLPSPLLTTMFLPSSVYSPLENLGNSP